MSWGICWDPDSSYQNGQIDHSGHRWIQGSSRQKPQTQCKEYWQWRMWSWECRNTSDWPSGGFFILRAFLPSSQGMEAVLQPCAVLLIEFLCIKLTPSWSYKRCPERTLGTSQRQIPRFVKGRPQYREFTPGWELGTSDRPSGCLWPETPAALPSAFIEDSAATKPTVFVEVSWRYQTRRQLNSRHQKIERKIPCGLPGKENPIESETESLAQSSWQASCKIIASGQTSESRISFSIETKPWTQEAESREKWKTPTKGDNINKPKTCAIKPIPKQQPHSFLFRIELLFIGLFAFAPVLNVLTLLFLQAPISFKAHHVQSFFCLVAIKLEQLLEHSGVARSLHWLWSQQ